MPTAEHASRHHKAASHATELSLVLMATIWGVNFSVVKYGTQVMEPIAYNALRMGLGCVVIRKIRPMPVGNVEFRPNILDVSLRDSQAYKIVFENEVAVIYQPVR